MKAKVTQKNPGWLTKVLERHKKLGDKVVAVGFPKGTKGAGAAYPNGTPLLNVAVWNNYGTGPIKPKGKALKIGTDSPMFLKGTAGIPRRDFMTAGAKLMNEKTKPLRKKFVKGINSGKIAPEPVLEQMGLVATSAMQSAMVQLKEPGNAPLTVKLKGSANPLVGKTGLLIGSVAHKVRGA